MSEGKKVKFEIHDSHLPLWENTNWRYAILMGGRGNGRSGTASRYTISQLLSKEYTRGAIMRATREDIRTSCWGELINRVNEQQVEKAFKITDNDMFMGYGRNSVRAHGFRASSGSLTARLKSLAEYNYIWIEEAEEIGEEEFRTLDDSLRTTKGRIRIVLTMNPPHKNHWIIRKWFNLTPSGVPDFYIPTLKPELKDTIFIGGNYTENLPNLDEHTIDRYKNYKKLNPKYYYQMIEGLVPEELRGRIFSGWRQIDEIPYGARLVRYGLDFGWFPDPTVLVAIYEYEGEYILEELLYGNYVQNETIASIIRNKNPNILCVADNNEQKSIDEIRKFGVNIIATEKGKDSVSYGIKSMSATKISVLRSSTHIWDAYENYAWKENKDGEPTGEPDHLWSHACFVAGTMVGSQKIEEVGIHTGFSDVYEYEIGNTKLTATPNHPVLTQRGLVDIDTLRYDDVIWNEKKLLFIKVSGGRDTQTVINGLTGLTIVAISRIVEATKLRLDSTDIFGKKKMGKFLKDTLYITKTTIPLIIRCLILSLLSGVNTLVCIGLKRSVNGLDKISRKLLKLHLIGLKHQMVFVDAKKLELQMPILCTISHISQNNAMCVEKNLKQNNYNELDFATITVVKKRYVGREPVYNLRTKSGMYQANGIVVSNCDAIRYGLISLPTIQQRDEERRDFAMRMWKDNNKKVKNRAI